MQKIFLILSLFLGQASLACNGKTPSEPVNLLETAINEQWQRLDGTAPRNWSLQDGSLHLERPEHGNDLISREVFGDFILKFKFRLPRAGNSGLKYLVQLEHGNVGLEYQLIDEHHKNGRLNAKRQLGSLYDIMASQLTPIQINKRFYQGCILFDYPRVEHWLENRLILQINLDSPLFHTLKSKSKFKKFPWFGTHKTGHLIIQDHGDQASFTDMYLYRI